MLLASCPMRGRFPEAILQRTERELAGPGRPGRPTRLVAKGGAPGGAAPYVTGRARSPCRARWVGNPASKGATSLRPGASRRSIALARFARDTGKPRTLCAARMRSHAPSFRGARALRARTRNLDVIARDAKHLWIPGSRRRGAPRNDGWRARLN